MKRIKKLFAGIFACSLVLTTVMPASAVAPYSSYTYDSYGNAVDMSNLYEPERVISGYDLGVTLMSQPTDMYVTDKKEIYILDAGYSRVLVLDENFKLKKNIDQLLLDGQPQELQKAEGIFVDEQGRIYIADTGNNRILCMNSDGSIFQVIEKPESEYFSEHVEFLPRKIVMDRAGNMYVQCTGIYQGLVIFDASYTFQGFFGSEKVVTTSQAIRDFFWKQFMTEEQKAAMANYVPPEIRNMDIGGRDFIYTITTAQFVPLSTTKTEMDSIRCLNPKGGDALVNKMPLNAYNAMEEDARDLNFVDICSDEKGFINLIDSKRGKIYQFDQNMNLITAFGGLSAHTGTFTEPVAIEVLDDRILVLDKAKATLTIFALTSTGKNVHTALQLYNEGKYTEAIEPWKKVVQENTNFELAYNGIGSALYNMQDYEEAMRYFKLGRDSEKYSEAFKEYRVALLRDNIGVIIVLLVLIYLLYKILQNRRRLFRSYYAKRERRD